MKFRLFKKAVVVIFLIILLLTTILPVLVFADEEKLPKIYSPAAVLMDMNTGKILYEKSSTKKRYPASLTKVMTAIVVLERCNLNDIATVSYDAVMNLGAGYVTANLQIGEELTIEQLLHILIVASSNDAATVLAEHVSGSVEDFSKLMNEKAKEIGCENTNFVNPNGVHDKNHYSTAYDLALMGRYAMQNDTFRNIVKKTSYTLPTTNKYKAEDRYFTTTNSLLIVNNNNRTDNYYYKYATGVKTGFTTPAGNCLIASSNKDKFELMTVVLGSNQTDAGLSERYLDTLSLFEYGYDYYTIKEVAKKGTIIQTYNVKGATRDTKRLDIVLEDTVLILAKKSNVSDTFLPEVQLNENLKAPINKGDVVGSVTYKVEDVTYTYSLTASDDVKVSKWFLRLVEFIFIIFIILIYLRLRLINKKRKRLKRKIYKKY